MHVIKINCFYSFLDVKSFIFHELIKVKLIFTPKKNKTRFKKNIKNSF